METKGQFNEELKDRLLKCGFAEAKNGDCSFSPAPKKLVIVTLEEEDLNIVNIRKNDIMVLSEIYNYSFEDIKAAVLRHLNYEIKEVVRYDWESCVVRPGAHVWISKHSQIKFDPDSDLVATYANHNTLPTLETANAALAMMQLCTVVEIINRDFPTKKGESSMGWPIISEATGGLTVTGANCNRFGLHSADGYRAFANEPSNIELLKQFQGLE